MLQHISDKLQNGIFAFSFGSAAVCIVKAGNQEVSFRYSCKLVVRQLETHHEVGLLFKINLYELFGQRPCFHLANAPLRVHDVFGGREFVQASRKVCRNLSGLYEFF